MEASKREGQTRPIDQTKLRKFQYKRLVGLLEGIGIGKMYWEVDVEKIRPLKFVKPYIDNLVENIQNGKGLVLSGGRGTGKTTILSYIAQKGFAIGQAEGYRGNNNGDVVFAAWKPAFKIQFISVSFLMSFMFDKDAETLKKYQTCDLLLLDDLGREYAGNDFFVSRFEDFIEYRYANMKSTCVTTNLNGEQLAKNKTYARVIDRFRDVKLYKIIQIAGTSLREGTK